MTAGLVEILIFQGIGDVVSQFLLPLILGADGPLAVACGSETARCSAVA